MPRTRLTPGMTHLGRSDAINVDDEADPTSSSLQGRVVEALRWRVLPCFTHPDPVTTTTTTTHSLHISLQARLFIHSLSGLTMEYQSATSEPMNAKWFKIYTITWTLTSWWCINRCCDFTYFWVESIKLNKLNEYGINSHSAINSIPNPVTYVTTASHSRIWSSEMTQRQGRRTFATNCTGWPKLTCAPS